MRAITKSMFVVSLMFFASPCFAAGDSDQAAELSGYSALYSIATPVLLTEAAGEASVAGVKRIVKLTNKTGDALSDLTSDVLNDIARDPADPSLDDCYYKTTPKAKIENKQIPLVVRHDYVELNEQVQPQ